MPSNSQKYKTILLKLQTTLNQELRSVGINDPHNPSDWIAVPENFNSTEADSDLIADTVESWNERQSLIASLERQYNDIKRALAKIDAGTFGTCEICGGIIEENRLDANPSARTDNAHLDDEHTLSL